MTLIIVHYHLRPGGIRRVIEMATPHLCRRLGKVKRIILACGEANDQNWNADFVRQLHPIPVEFFIKPALGYVSEQRFSGKKTAAAVATAVRRLFDGLGDEPGLVWAHNLGVGRNLIITHELVQACGERRLPMVAHHHDWWFDNRWSRWPEIQRTGFRTLEAAARAIFPVSPNVRQAAINSEDATILEQYFPDRSGWLPNLAAPAAPPTPARERQARRWLKRRLDESDAPVWILPCRLLRRKNVAEALLLTRWLRPEAWLIITGGASSQDERAYFKKLEAAAHKHRWQLRFGVLANGETREPSVAELIAASECVLLTSIQEGFGLPYLEAAAARRPLIARALPNIAPDLARFGFRFPQYYDEILVHTGLFDWKRERKRQRRKFNAWRRRLPRELRKLATETAILAARKMPRAVPFSHLTLDAQLEVLAQPVARSWQLCLPLNPFLKTWQARAAQKKLQVTRWPQAATRWLGGSAYAKNFQRLVQSRATPRPGKWDAAKVQMTFIKKKLAAGNAHPLLWDSNV